MLFNKRSNHRSGSGFSLVEIMIAVVVGMLGILVISSMLHMVGNILSDILYCVVDPRIRFQ